VDFEMSARLSLFLYIVLCFLVGIILIILPWVPHGWLWGVLGDWGNNYFLMLAANKTGYGLQRFVASGWVRGAVSGVGVLNLAMGVWEIINFGNTARAMDVEALPVRDQASPQVVSNDEVRTVKTDPLSDYPRRNR
jgi:hypothetical protein